MAKEEEHGKEKRTDRRPGEDWRDSVRDDKGRKSKGRQGKARRDKTKAWPGKTYLKCSTNSSLKGIFKSAASSSMIFPKHRNHKKSSRLKYRSTHIFNSHIIVHGSVKSLYLSSGNCSNK